MVQYQKPYLTLEQQLQKLEGRGMSFTSRQLAKDYLARIGYYRLSAYWYPFRDFKNNQIQNDFKAGTQFQTIVGLYVFDKRLRLMMLDALERIEIALRTEISLILGKRDAWAHTLPMHLDGRFSIPINTRDKSHVDWLKKHQSDFGRSKEDFIRHYKTKYDEPIPPIWVSCEIMDFGSLSILAHGMKWQDKQALSNRFGVSRPQLFLSGIKALSNVRNTCAHHARLWNIRPVVQISPLRSGEVHLLDHVSDTRKFYSLAALTAFLVRQINPNSTWPQRMQNIIQSFPSNPHVSLKGSGFNEFWEREQVWQ